MKKLTAVLFPILILGAFFVVFKAKAAEEPVLSQKEVADLAKPSVVKIVQRVKGKATVPSIDVDFLTMSVSTRSDVSPDDLQIDEYLVGTGVIVTPDGYIMTNSHVVSYQTVKNLIVSDYVYSAIDEGYSKLSEEDVNRLSENKNQEEFNKFSEKIADYILNESQFNVEKTVTVLNPSSKKESIEDLAGEGFPAAVVSVNDNFFKDSRDAALIKIDQPDLPAAVLGDSSSVSTGKKVYILGYPSTAEVSEKDLLEPTFSQGTISAMKDSLNKDFKILQTDAKISKGSSGGPLLDEQGKVIGLVTFITSDLTKQDGDSFAFAVPINVAKETLANNKTAEGLPVDYRPGNYAEHFLLGLELLKSRQCKKAITEFNLAKQSNAVFGASNYPDAYLYQCEKITAAGNSLDTSWEVFKEKIKDAKYLVLILAVGGVGLAIILGLLWAWLFRKMRRDEKEMDNVEEYLHLNLEDGKPPEVNSEEKPEDSNQENKGTPIP